MQQAVGILRLRRCVRTEHVDSARTAGGIQGFRKVWLELQKRTGLKATRPLAEWLYEVGPLTHETRTLSGLNSISYMTGGVGCWVASVALFTGIKGSGERIEPEFWVFCRCFSGFCWDVDTFAADPRVRCWLPLMGDAICQQLSS